MFIPSGRYILQSSLLAFQFKCSGYCKGHHLLIIFSLELTEN